METLKIGDMTSSGNVDQDAVVRARAILLGSGRVDQHQEIWACRVLAQVSPSAYLPRLTQALITFGYQQSQDHPEARLAVHEEAVAAARRMDETLTKRTELLISALDSYQHQLYALERRADGFAVRQEMAEIGRCAFEAGLVKDPAYGLKPLAAALAEEGHHLEAAQACSRIVEAGRAESAYSSASFWSILEWAAELDAAGLHATARDAFTELVTTSRAKAREAHGPLAILVWALVSFSRMLDAHDLHDLAREARQEAGAVLAELAKTGEPKSWSNILHCWTVLLGLSGRPDEPTTPGVPTPPFGFDFGCSPDVRKAYLAECAVLEQEIVDLAERVRTDPRRHLCALVTAQHRLTIRSVIAHRSHHYRFLETLQPQFDEGVTLTRQLTELDHEQGSALLARALIDRSTLLVAAKGYGEAYGDFQEASELLA
jgi:hypothetical protein